jgi:hypothetical protein
MAISFVLIFPYQQSNLFLQPGHDSAFGQVDCGDRKAEFLGDVPAWLTFHGRLPEGIPRRVGKVLFDNPGGKLKQLPLIVRIPFGT